MELPVLLIVNQCRTLSDNLYNGYRLLACDGSDINAILMADRSYESFNTFAHLIRKKIHFVIRMKDINSNGILSSYDFLGENCMYYDIEFQIVRIRLDNGTYICIATNLSEEEFPLKKPNTSIKLISPPQSTYAGHISNMAVTKRRPCFSYKDT